MNSQKRKKSNIEWWLVVLIGGMLLVAFALAAPTSPVSANPPAQDGYPVDTETPTPTSTTTPSITVVVSNVTVTATRSGTLAPPVNTGTPTQIIPVTGADLTQDPPGSRVGMWVAIWLVGMLLVGFGVRSRLRGKG